MKTFKPAFLVISLALLVFLLLPACSVLSPAPTPVSAGTATAIPPTPQPVLVLNIQHPQAPTLLNPHLSRNVKDLEPARIVYEPLAVFNNNGELVPILAAEIPSLDNGGLPQDGKSVTWKLRQDVRWSDGEPFTSDDVLFTYSYITNPDVKASTASTYSQVTDVQAIDKFTIKITFKDVNPAWALPFVGNSGVILPKHIFESYVGVEAASVPAHKMPIGTGPYRVIEPGIKPQEVLLLGSQVVKTAKIVYEPNPYYRLPEKIYFQKIVWRGGGTGREAARLSLQDGSVDLAYDLDTVALDELEQLQTDGKGRLLAVFGAGTDRLLLNRTDPKTPSADDEYSNLDIQHPFLSDKMVRQAIAHAINREAIANLYRQNGQPAYVNLVAPPQYRSSNIFYAYDLQKAKALLDEAGYVDTDGDKIREKDGIVLKIVFQSAVNTIQQQIQKIIQQDLISIGIDTELKITDSSIMFAAGSANPDSAYRFNADMMMFRIGSGSPDPSGFMGIWICAAIPQKANNWAGLNFERWCNTEYDALLQQAKIELDPAKRAEMFIQLNDMLMEDVVMIPTVWRASALGLSDQLTGPEPTPWDSITWNIQDWHFTTP